VCSRGERCDPCVTPGSGLLKGLQAIMLGGIPSYSMSAAPSKLFLATVAFASALAIGGWLFVEADRTFASAQAAAELSQRERFVERREKLQAVQKLLESNRKLRDKWLPVLQGLRDAFSGLRELRVFLEPFIQGAPRVDLDADEEVRFVENVKGLALVRPEWKEELDAFAAKKPPARKAELALEVPDASRAVSVPAAHAVLGKKLQALEARADGELWQLLLELDQEFPAEGPVPKEAPLAGGKKPSELLGTFPLTALGALLAELGLLGVVFTSCWQGERARSGERKKLQAAERMQRDILEHSAECVVLLDSKGCVDFVSEAARNRAAAGPMSRRRNGSGIRSRRAGAK